jgi:hypothetical protein
MKEIKKALEKHFKEMCDSNLFRVELDRDKVFQVYLEAFPEETRQHHNCNCCKSFLRQFGGIICIKDNKVVTLWDFEAPEQYVKPVEALRKYVKSLPITAPLFVDVPKCGTNKNPDKVNNIIWEHLYIEVPNKYVLKDPGSKINEVTTGKSVFQRALEEISEESVSTILELIAQNSIYRGTQYKESISNFEKIQKQYKKVPQKLRDNFCWNSYYKNEAVARLRNTAIGTLLVDLSEGKDLDKAVGAFEKMVAPANYKRSQALVSPRMVEQAKVKLEELGMTNSLLRRQLTTKDLNVNNSLFTYRTARAQLEDVFEQVKKDALVNPKTLSKVEEVSIDKFISDILPKVKSFKVLLENSHLSNFVTLVGPQEQDDKSMFQWQNNVSWSYTGGVTDSIKEKVKSAGGNVEGKLRISLSWKNTDDLDIHTYTPKQERIYYGHRKSLCGGELDVDMNAGGLMSEDPVENIFWRNNPPVGTYSVMVNNFNKRRNDCQGFDVEIEYNGESFFFSYPNNAVKDHCIARFSIDSKGEIKFSFGLGGSNSSTYSEKEKWNLKTGRFHQVKAMTLSPNFWQDKGVGNKHFFFFLDKCESDETIRPFYNEFLSKDLHENRKVFEVLASKIKVEPCTNELSGLGFSETMRNHLFAEVNGSFKRTVKITF